GGRAQPQRALQRARAILDSASRVERDVTARGRDALRAQGRDQSLAGPAAEQLGLVAGEDEMVAVARHLVVGALRDEAADLAQATAQICPVSRATLGPLLHARELRAQDGGLELSHPEVVAERVMLIPLAIARAPAVLERPGPLEQLRVAGG